MTPKWCHDHDQAAWSILAGWPTSQPKVPTIFVGRRLEGVYSHSCCAWLLMLRKGAPMGKDLPKLQQSMWCQMVLQLWQGKLIMHSAVSSSLNIWEAFASIISSPGSNKYHQMCALMQNLHNDFFSLLVIAIRWAHLTVTCIMYLRCYFVLTLRQSPFGFSVVQLCMSHRVFTQHAGLGYV